MDSNLKRSVFKLFIACVVLATGSVMYALLLDRVFGPFPGSVRPRRISVPATSVVEQAAVTDRQLEQLGEFLNRQEGESLRFPVGVEEAMLGEAMEVRDRIE